MARKYTRRGQTSAPPSTTQGVEPVSMDALNTTTPAAPPIVDQDAVLAQMVEAQRIADDEKANAFALYEAVPAVKMVAMELLRNYRPAGVFEIVGHVVPSVKGKDAAGREYEIQKSEFIQGEMAPPPIAGVGTIGKIWAGTVIRVPAEEAKTMRTNGIAERSVDD